MCFALARMVAELLEKSGLPAALARVRPAAVPVLLPIPARRALPLCVRGPFNAVR